MRSIKLRTLRSGNGIYFPKKKKRAERKSEISRESIEAADTRLFDNDDDGRATCFPDYRKVSSRGLFWVCVKEPV